MPDKEPRTARQIRVQLHTIEEKRAAEAAAKASHYPSASAWGRALMLREVERLRGGSQE